MTDTSPPDRTARRRWGAVCLFLITVVVNLSLSTVWQRQRRADQWLWASVVTPTSFELRVKGEGYIVVGPSEHPGSPHFFTQLLRGTMVHNLTVTGLQPDTQYYYGLVEQPLLRPSEPGRVRTWAVGVQPTLRVGVASCATTESNDPVFDEIAEARYDLFLHMGDLHYGDIGVNDVQAYRDAFALVHGAPRQRRLFQSAPVAYVWDDHDWGGNDVGAEAPSAEAARAALRECVPKPQVSGQPLAAYHAFSVGRTRFVMADARSESTNESIMSDGQMEWLLDEIRNAGKHMLLVLMLGQPWIGEAPNGTDGWRGHRKDREKVSKAIADGRDGGGYMNVLGVSGDAHMLAFDDGTHTDYSGRGAGFPLLQAAPLHRFGSAKGGPYTTECLAYKYANNHQYGSLEITDTGAEDPNAICVRVRMHRSRGEVLHDTHFCGPMVRSYSSETVQCNIGWFPQGEKALLVCDLLTLVGLVVLAAYYPCQREGWLAVLVSVVSLLTQVILFNSQKMRQLPVDDPWRHLVFQLLIQTTLLGYFAATWYSNTQGTPDKDSGKPDSGETDSGEPQE